MRVAAGGADPGECNLGPGSGDPGYIKLDRSRSRREEDGRADGCPSLNSLVTSAATIRLTKVELVVQQVGS